MRCCAKTRSISALAHERGELDRTEEQGERRKARTEYLRFVKETVDNVQDSLWTTSCVLLLYSVRAQAGCGCVDELTHVKEAVNTCQFPTSRVSNEIA